MSSKTMIDTDDPQHWPGDPGAVIEATSDERAARYVNTDHQHDGGRGR